MAKKKKIQIFFGLDQDFEFVMTRVHSVCTLKALNLKSTESRSLKNSKLSQKPDHDLFFIVIAPSPTGQ